MNKYTLILGLFLLTCQAPQQPTTEAILDYQKIQGQTMGTIVYNITYDGENNYKNTIDSILQEINNEVSTYVPNSSISRFNRSEGGIKMENIMQRHFLKNISIANEVFQKTEGAFDATVMPLVNYWGFGYTGKEAVTAVDRAKIDSLLQYVSMERVSIGQKKVSKESVGVQLDFSASAKGYAIDEVGRFLEQKGILDYMIEIGGEVRTRGENPSGNSWRMGINTPREGTRATDIFAIVKLDNHSIATSGNYRNYYTISGVTYSHTINPITGLPERTNLLSASIITKECAYADAYATACMVLGLEKAKKLVNSLEDLEAYFIYSDGQNELKTYATEDIKDFVERL